MKVLFGISLLIFSMTSFAFDQSHSLLTSMLVKHTVQKDGQTWVNYADWKSQSSADLEAYLKDVSSVTTDEYNNFSNDEKLAFLMNAYNAFTVKLINDNYPVRSIKNITRFPRTPWEIPFISLLGKTITLDQLEHGTIRVQFNEPRIHFAVNCASVGCPTLRPEAYRGSDLESQLAEQEELFFKNQRHIKITSTRFVVSKLFDWYGGDWIKKYGSIESYLSDKSFKYGLVTDQISANSISIRYIPYDWNLNGI